VREKKRVEKFNTPHSLLGSQSGDCQQRRGELTHTKLERSTPTTHVEERWSGSDGSAIENRSGE